MTQPMATKMNGRNHLSKSCCKVLGGAAVVVAFFPGAGFLSGVLFIGAAGLSADLPLERTLRMCGEMRMLDPV